MASAFEALGKRCPSRPPVSRDADVLLLEVRVEKRLHGGAGVRAQRQVQDRVSVPSRAGLARRQPARLAPRALEVRADLHAHVLGRREPVAAEELAGELLDTLLVVQQLLLNIVPLLREVLRSTSVGSRWFLRAFPLVVLGLL